METMAQDPAKADPEPDRAPANIPAGWMAGPSLAHGGALSAARRRFPDAPSPLIDLSTGINPVAYPMPDLPDEAFTRLPDPESEAELQQAAARAYGAADPAMVVSAPGTQILISLLPHLLAPAANVAIVSPTYGEHAAAWAQAGAAVIEAATLADCRDAEIAVVCNPNNPDGARTDSAALLSLADRLASRGGWLVVDEAFADFEGPGLSVVPALPHPGLVVLRSFGKSYGLAGLRLGFALTTPALATRLRRALGPWAVSGPALVVAGRALADDTWRQDSIARLDRDTRRLDALLSRAGTALIGGTRLFRLYQGDHAAGLADHLGAAGILVRQFAGAPDRLRLGLPGTPTAWCRIETSLAEWSNSR